MVEVLETISQKFELFLLILVRVSGVFVITPVFGRRNVPAIFKVGLSFVLSTILINTVEARGELYTDIFSYSFLVARELIIGLIIGFITYLVFTSIYIAGQIIDMEIGFGVVNVLDPQNNVQVPVMGNFLYIVALLIFITVDGHHMIISALHKSFQMVPVGSGVFSNQLIGDMVKMFGDTFIIGFKIGAPVVAAIFLTDVALGILARTIPQMNVFVVGMPFKIIVGMLTIMIMIPAFLVILDVLVSNMAEGIYRALTHLM